MPAMTVKEAAKTDAKNTMKLRRKRNPLRLAQKTLATSVGSNADSLTLATGGMLAGKGKRF